LLYMSHMAEEIDRYLLRGSGIVLDPEYVFLNMDRTEIGFCYDPCSGAGGADGLNCMARFILDHIDYDDRKCTSLAYSLFQESMKESVSIADFAKLALGYDMEDRDETCEIAKNGQTECVLSDMQNQDTEEPENVCTDVSEASVEWKKYILEIVILGSLNAVLLAAFLGGIGVLHNYLPADSLEMIVVSAAGVLMCAMVIAAVEHLMINRNVSGNPGSVIEGSGERHLKNTGDWIIED